MPQLRYLIHCDHAETDAHTQKLVLNGLFDRLVANRFPAVFQFFVVLGLTGLGDYLPHQVSVSVFGPGGALLSQSGPLEIMAPNDLSTANLILQYVDFGCPEPGVYWFAVDVDQASLDSYGLLVEESETNSDAPN